MIRGRIQIGGGEILDTFDGWGFIYMDADERTEAPIKKRETTSYAEEAGEYLDPRTVQDAFDYKVKFLIECPNRNLENANAKIAAFNSALYTTSYNSDIRTYKEVTFYNDYNRVKIVGFPEPIAQPTDFFRRQDGSALDCAQVELKIRVSDPKKCDFNMLLDEKPVEPDNPGDSDTTIDALGIEWYTLTSSGEYAAKVSKLLSIFPNLASFTNVIDGQTIHYYNRESILRIAAVIRNMHGVDDIFDPIYLMFFTGLSTQEPVDLRTVWNVNVDVDGNDINIVRGDVIITYPEMGYFKDGVWQQGDTFFYFNDNKLYINEVQYVDGSLQDKLLYGDDVAIPLKVMIEMDGTSTLSLAKTFNSRESIITESK